MPSSGGRKGKGGRPGPPPDATGDELRYVSELKERARTLVLHMSDGSEIRGHIEYFDRDMLKITRADGPHLFVRKSDIRYWVEA